MSVPPNLMQPPPGAQPIMPGPGSPLQTVPRIAEEGEWVELPQSDDVEVEETPDGGANILIDAGHKAVLADDDSFYDNLVGALPEDYLSSLAVDLIQKIERDKESRTKRDEMYAEGIRRTGIGKDAPGGADFQGASRAVHPMLTKAAIEYESRAMKEVFPAQGPVKTFIPGTLTKARTEKAERLKRFYNWLFVTQMVEFRPGLEQTLTQSALAGVQYMRYRWDPRLRRPVQNVVHQDMLLLPYDAASLWAAERITFVDDITELEYRKRVRDGIYRDVDLVNPAMRPDQTKSAEARDKAEGKEPEPYNQDGTRRTFEVSVYLDDLEEHLTTNTLNGEVEKGETLPYLLYIDETTRMVLGVTRNWERTDKRHQRMQWIVEWPFVPWTGAYPIGLVHLIGSLSAAATGSLRALLDAAHIQNFQTAFAIKGPNVAGQSQQVKPTQINFIRGGVGGDDIRKMVYPVNSSGPSPTLFQLLGFLVDTGEGFIQTAFEKLSDNNPNAPVGTTYALIEQGLSVVSTIIGRCHFAMFNTLQVIHRIMRMYQTDEQVQDEAGEILAYRQDFQGPMDVVPVSDPGIPSDAHRFAQMQVVVQRADLKPYLYNQRRVEKMVLERLRVQDPDSYLAPLAEPQEMNAANENAALIFNRPLCAYPQQDHLAHLQVHVDFMMSPVIGMLPNMSHKVLAPMLEHIAQHVALWYLGRVYHTVAANVQGDLGRYMDVTDPMVKQELDRTIAAASRSVMDDAMAALNGLQLPAVIQRAQQLLQQMMPPMQNPQMAAAQAQVQTANIRAQASNQATQARMQEANLRLIDSREKRQSDLQHEQQRQMSENQRALAGLQVDLHRSAEHEAHQDMRAAAQNETKERINLEDNATAREISAAEIASGRHASLSTGRGTSREGRGVSQ